MSTYRQIYKWGDKRDSALDEHTLQFLEQYFGVQRTQQRTIGDALRADSPVQLPVSRLAADHLRFFQELVGQQHVQQEDFMRASHALGKYYGDLLLLRHRRVPYPPDAVVCPETHEQVQQIVDYCHQHCLPIVPVGGGSSVTQALEARQGGIALNLRQRMRKVLRFRERNQTVRVQAGIYGPELEAYLNERGYSCGHFPQSFEYSTVGGWVAANGAGQCSTGYGRAVDLMVALQVATPIGSFQSLEHPACAQGWDLNRLFVGSEGVLGVITEVTWRVVPHRPQNRQQAAFIFRDFASATEAMRAMIQGEIGKPHVFRISDGRETSFGFKHRGFEGTWKDRLLRGFGYHPPQRSTLMMTIEGNMAFTRCALQQAKRIAKRHGGFSAGQSPVTNWLQQRYESSYLRDAFMDAGYMIDTAETAVTWETLLPLWKGVHEYFDRCGQPIYSMSHISHVYENGCNLYVVFMAPMQSRTTADDVAQFQTLQQGLLRTFVQQGGSISHHHGVGRMGSDLMVTQVGECGIEILKSIKRSLDPHGIMNPGGMLGLDN
ncbi:MAG: FAD-binding oxidoreductase [Pirellulaceae bacterium]|nr:FAD-binding oxidoreductase [Pirellulaceae bacterium]